MVIIHLVFGLDQEHSGDELELTLWWKPFVLPGVPGDLRQSLPEEDTHFQFPKVVPCDAWNMLVVEPGTNYLISLSL